MSGDVNTSLIDDNTSPIDVNTSLIDVNTSPIDDNTSMIRLSSRYLHKKKRLIKVLVGARDGGRPSLTGTLTVQVLVADINDNYPVFDKYTYSVNVSETTRTNHPLLQVHAKDADVGPNGNLTYRFSQLQPKESIKLFNINPVSGTMFLSQSVENQTGRIFELVVEATDHGSPPKVSRAMVRVRVLDTVNSRPDIMVDILRSLSGQSEVSEYSEVGKVVAYVSVTDPDSGENGVTVCRLNTKDFELQPLSSQGQYKVILVTNLDRERINRYQISVTCTDFGFPPLENSVRFQVNIRDENDNAPIFSQRSYFTSLRENGSAGAVVTLLTAHDADQGDNAQVTYRVAGAHRDRFKILDNGTMIALTPLDREESERLIVKVLAIDKGYPPLTGSATVFITLEDVNDMPPRFSDQGYSFNVAEDARAGTFVGIVAARDDDQGVNAEVSFVPSPGSAGALSPFVITREGVVQTKRALDRERAHTHYFTVVAHDGGSPSLSSTTTLTIHVNDVNDNTPYFLYPSEANDSLSIPHTYPIRIPITQIRASDRDSSQNAALVYSCASVNNSGLFGMDPNTGDLYLQRYFGRRQVGLYILRVAAHDLGTPQLSNQTLLFLEVYFDNSTLLDSAQKAAPSTALITALVLVGVVCVVGVVALAAIICIRRRDSRKKQQTSSCPASAQPNPPPPKSQSGYYIAPGVCESPAYGGGMSSTAVLNKPVPEQSQDGAGHSGLDMTHEGSNLRSVNPYVIMPPHSNYSDADGQPEIIEISRNGLFHRAEDPYPGDDGDQADDSHFSTFRSQDGAYVPNYGHNSLQRHVGAALKTSSPLPYKGGGSHNANPPYRPRDPEVSFTTFRGDSPCSFRFDSDSDSTLTRPQRVNPHSGSNPRTSPLPVLSAQPQQPPGRSLHSGVAGSSAPSGVRPLHTNYGAEPDSGDESGSLGRKSTTPRRAITPGADFSRYGSYGPTFHLAPSGVDPDSYGVRRDGEYGQRGGGGHPHYETDGDYGRVRRTSTDMPVFRSQTPSDRLYGGRSNTVPPVDFRGRQTRQTPDYVKSYSREDAGHGADTEPTEDQFLLPPYPEMLEEEEEGREGELSERSALNFVPGLTNRSRTSSDSGRARRSSEV
ncbi:hypothetical protein ACOMHN_005165 [Nucella lapillus]